MQYLPFILAGAITTIKISISALILGSIIGIALAVLASSGSRIAFRLVSSYVELIRSIPSIIILFFVFYGLPVAINVDISPLIAAIGSLTLYCSAYMTEVVRSGLDAIHKGQREAAAALGLTPVKIFCFVVFPQALKIMMPAGVNVAISTVKESSLASSIGFMELMGAGLAVREQTVNQGGSNAILIVALIFFIICFGLSCVGEYVLKNRQVIR